MISMNWRPPRASARHQAREVPHGEGPAPEQVELEHRVVDVVLDDHEAHQHGGRRRSGPSTKGLVHPMVWPP
jgi:hypothetical protein